MSQSRTFAKLKVLFSITWAILTMAVSASGHVNLVALVNSYHHALAPSFSPYITRLLYI